MGTHTIAILDAGRPRPGTGLVHAHAIVGPAPQVQRAAARHRGAAAPQPLRPGPARQTALFRPGGDAAPSEGPGSGKWRTQPGGVSDAKGRAATGEHNFEVVGIARVEGEGTLRLRITDGEVTRGAPVDLRGAPLLREAGRRPDAQRSRRHRRPHLRHLPGRLPDGRVDGLRAPLRGRDRPAGSGAAQALLLGRMDREPRPPRLHAPRPGLPGLRERDRHGPRPQAGRGAGAAPEADRQRAS